MQCNNFALTLLRRLNCAILQSINQHFVLNVFKSTYFISFKISELKAEPSQIVLYVKFSTTLKRCFIGPVVSCCV